MLNKKDFATIMKLFWKYLQAVLLGLAFLISTLGTITVAVVLGSIYDRLWALLLLALIVIIPFWVSVLTVLSNKMEHE